MYVDWKYASGIPRRPQESPSYKNRASFFKILLPLGVTNWKLLDCLFLVEASPLCM